MWKQPRGQASARFRPFGAGIPELDFPSKRIEVSPRHGEERERGSDRPLYQNRWGLFHPFGLRESRLRSGPPPACHLEPGEKKLGVRPNGGPAARREVELSQRFGGREILCEGRHEASSDLRLA